MKYLVACLTVSTINHLGVVMVQNEFRSRKSASTLKRTAGCQNQKRIDRIRAIIRHTDKFL